MNHKRLMLKRRQRLKRMQTFPEKAFKESLQEMEIIHRVQYLIYLWQFNKSYVLDFFLPEHNVAVEIDGDSHDDPIQKEYDRVRDERLLNVLGIQTVRFQNEEIHNALITIHLIKEALKDKPKLIAIQHTKVPHRIDTRRKYPSLAFNLVTKGN